MGDDGGDQLYSNRVVEGILSFSHWPNMKGKPLLCVSPQVSYFDKSKAGDSQIYKEMIINNPADFASTGCNAIYLGQESDVEKNEIINSLSGKNILTISENNIDCAAGAAFCINKRKHAFIFSINFDSLARSGVKVNSDVLLLSKDADN